MLLAAEDNEALAHKVYHIGLRGYSQPNYLDSYRVWLDDSSHADDKLRAEAGAVSTVILRIVGLHELGHLMLGHEDTAGMCYNQTTERVEYEQSEHLDQLSVWEMEYAADRFAIDHMLAHTGGAEQMWNNVG